MKSIIILLTAISTLASFSCTRESIEDQPNVILIMADDMGYECLSVYGSLSYQTPNLDALASDGILFSRCISQPLCTPSRVKIMTGMYNYRNYDYFGNLNTEEYTFGNLMRDAGYATCISGKWQLNGNISLRGRARMRSAERWRRRYSTPCRSSPSTGSTSATAPPMLLSFIRRPT